MGEGRRGDFTGHCDWANRQHPDSTKTVRPHKSDVQVTPPTVVHFLDDRSRADARRAIAAGACSGNGNTELTLISQSTCVSSPADPRGPYRKSASQMIGSALASISSNCIICGVHFDSIFVLSV